MKKIILLLGLMVPLAGLAQQYSIDWYKVSGGGGTSTGGTYSVSGTIGQHDAGGPMTGGNYSLTGGFWSLIAVVQTPGLPNLIITHSGNSVVVSWPDTGSYTLQQNSNLATELDDERLHHHHRQRHQQHHHHATDWEFVFPLEQSVAKLAGASRGTPVSKFYGRLVGGASYTRPHFQRHPMGQGLV